ncbi:ArsR family transcriptional regulator [Haloterrigena sp. SYSU A558-1]|uniref:ArsR family transcriptional regulator n=1 Tax=Haloterrigena gelatinilytica TaxID=2741724 RepID=A0A8J8GTZ9_9EURY|nr:ArsR family transcriptional regulator [Haloterrigena gelatinilytica]NUB93962.1 ArsR family transcriptional regulator [Haloterrigena gelatinilytica]NUC74890.1 ArsR family transcriptional regulator [Haloterrigena gelatinilytica]
MSVQTNRTESLEESEVFHILGNDRRRAIVQLLAEEAGQVDVSDIASEIAASETDTTPVPNNLYKSVYVSLQQTHLPQLQEDAVIEYDSDSKTITPGPNFEDVLQYIDGHGELQASVLQLHLAFCIVGLAIIALAGLGIPLVSSIDPVLSSVLVFLIVAASSLYRLLS